MEENTIEKGRFEPGEERPPRALRRKAELLSVVFGLPKPDIASTSVENMPEMFKLPKEMIEVLREIIAQKDSNETEYALMGDTTRGKLFFDSPKKGNKESAQIRIESLLLWFIGRRRISIHSHPEGGIGFSPEDMTYFFLMPDLEILAILSRLGKGQDEAYGFLMTIKGAENLERQKALLKTYKKHPLRLPGQNAAHLNSRWGKTGVYNRTLEEIAALFENNGCTLYAGYGHIGSKNVDAIKVHPFNFAEFEEDPRTKLMLPKV